MLAKTEINTGRQIEADLAKFVCLVGMVIVHCFDVFVSFSDTSSSLQFVFLFVLNCIFGAGTFMFCMGIGLAYSSRNTPREIMKRGISIFLLGYLLNLACALSYLILLRDFSLFITYFLGLDILQFAGLALFLFGCLKRFAASDILLGILAVALSLIGTLIGTVDLGNPLLNIFCGLFFGSFDYDWLTGGIFPLFNWFIFVAAGYLFAKYILRRAENKGRIYLLFSGVSAVIAAGYMAIAIPRGLGMMGSVLRFHHIRFHEALVSIAGALLALGVYYALLHVISRKLQELTVRVSRNIKEIYCIQWIILAWTVSIWVLCGQKAFSDGIIVLLGLVIFALSACLAQLFAKRRKARKESDRVILQSRKK